MIFRIRLSITKNIADKTLLRNIADFNWFVAAYTQKLELFIRKTILSSNIEIKIDYINEKS